MLKEIGEALITKIDYESRETGIVFKKNLQKLVISLLVICAICYGDENPVHLGHIKTAVI